MSRRSADGIFSLGTTPLLGFSPLGFNPTADDGISPTRRTVFVRFADEIFSTRRWQCRLAYGPLLD